MQQLDFIVQKVASQERKTGRLDILPTTSSADLREFLRRTTSVCDATGIPREPYSVSPSQVFHRLILDAKKIPDDK